ncbi:hypothetical protein ABNX05_19820 [Lysinibacillus sp. M3]|uniref:Uncharacterized protein n=1 Tax=Lysinibacillus zambalensis TaxID=3160866 RepID=A0ABV1MWK1_9BACI
MAFLQSEGLISVPAGRFVAAATLALRFRTEQSFLGAPDEPLRFAAGRRANTRLVTKALSQDVMVLAFVPLLLIPEESPSLHSNQLLHMTYVLTKCHQTFEFYRNTFTFYRPIFEFYRLTFTFYHPTFNFYRHPPAKEQKKIHT